MRLPIFAKKNIDNTTATTCPNNINILKTLYGDSRKNVYIGKHSVAIIKRMAMVLDCFCARYPLGSAVPIAVIIALTTFMIMIMDARAIFEFGEKALITED